LTAEIPFGMLCSFQVVPPLVVAMTTPVPAERWPTALQVVADAQAIPLTAEIPFGMLCIFQVVPPFVVPMTTPVLLPLLPTASQAVDDLQEMSVRTRATTGYDLLMLQTGDLAPATAGNGASTPRRTRTDTETRAIPSRTVRNLDRFTRETPPSSRHLTTPARMGPRRHFYHREAGVGSSGRKLSTTSQIVA
jgi:hypothetical protein